MCVKALCNPWSTVNDFIIFLNRMVYLFIRWVLDLMRTFEASKLVLVECGTAVYFPCTSFHVAQANGLRRIILLTSRHYNLFFLCFSQTRNAKDKICKCAPRNLGTWFCPWLLWNARDKSSRGRAAHTEALWATPVDQLYPRGSLGSGGGWHSKKTSSQKIWGDSPIVLGGKNIDSALQRGIWH